MISDKSLKTRLLVAAILVPLFSGFILLGGWGYAVLIAVALAIGTWEYWRLFRVGDFSPSLLIMMLGTISLLVLRYFFQFQYDGLWLTLVILLSMTVAVFQQANKIPNAAFNFAITVSGMLYVGWLGSFTLPLRSLPLGLAWTLLVIFAAAICDAGAYLFGSLFGKHKIAPAISPKKSWEGYFGGVLTATLATWLAAILLHHFFAQLIPWHGLILGAILAILTPLGDFAESMLKRLFNLKDTSHILPGHGGILDRIDSSLWAVAIGYYIILLLK